MISIRALQRDDYDGWLNLWDQNNMGQSNPAVTLETWRRLLDRDSPVKGFCAVASDKIIGLVHYVLHPTTGNIEPVCYMQDVFVDPEHRRKGIGRMLVQEVADAGRRQKWARLYWLAEGKNEAAQEFYKDFGVKLNFTLHVMPLGMTT